jgi:hypothetical protein
MIQADQARFNGRDRAALSSGFIQHGVLAPAAAASLAQAPRPQMAAVAAAAGGQLAPTFGDRNEGYRSTAQDAPALPTRSVATPFGFSIEVHAPEEAPRFTVAPAALGVGPSRARSAEEEARAFVEDLIQLGRIDFEPARNLVPAELVPPDARSRSKQTHTFVPSGGKLVLKRLHVNCGFGGCSCRR